MMMSISVSKKTLSLFFLQITDLRGRCAKFAMEQFYYGNLLPVTS